MKQEIGSLGSYKIIENPLLVEDGVPISIVRTWMERLFSRPWKPWQRTYIKIPQVPMQCVYRSGNTLIMHPDIAKKLAQSLINKERQEELRGGSSGQIFFDDPAPIPKDKEKSI